MAPGRNAVIAFIGNLDKGFAVHLHFTVMCRGLPLEGLGVAPSRAQQVAGSARPPQFDDTFLQYTFKVIQDATSVIGMVHVSTAHSQLSSEASTRWFGATICSYTS